MRMLYGGIGDRQMDSILQHIVRHGLKDPIRRKNNFDWHRGLIADLRKRLPLGGLGVSTLFRC